MSDNLPPEVLGSGAIMYRADGSGSSINSGENYLATGFFDNLAENSSDIESDLSTGSFTVSIDGWYRAEVRLKLDDSGDSPSHLELILEKTTDVDTQKRYMGHDHGRYAAAHDEGASANTYGPDGVYGSCPVYLQAGDSARVKYKASSSKGSFDGDTAGERSWFALTLINRSLT